MEGKVIFLTSSKGKILHISCKIKVPQINTSISKAKFYCGLKESKASSVGARKDVKRGEMSSSVLMGHSQNINVIADGGKSSA